jgi:hypothetical protein
MCSKLVRSFLLSAKEEIFEVFNLAKMTLNKKGCFSQPFLNKPPPLKNYLPLESVVFRLLFFLYTLVDCADIWFFLVFEADIFE